MGPGAFIFGERMGPGAHPFGNAWAPGGPTILEYLGPFRIFGPPLLFLNKIKNTSRGKKTVGLEKNKGKKTSFLKRKRQKILQEKKIEVTQTEAKNAQTFWI